MLIILALVSDIRTYKIKNAIVFPFMILGVLTALVMNGPYSALMSLWAIALPILLLFALYALRMLGAGDIKLFSAIGAIMGSGYVLNTIAYSFVSGGVLALAILITRKNGRQRIGYLINYIKMCILTFSFHPYTDFKNKNDGSKLHFSIAITCGALIQAVLIYMQTA